MKPSNLRIDFKILHEMLRLPHDVRIVGVTGDSLGSCCLQMVGALPHGEVTAHYVYKHTTVVDFERFEKLVEALPTKALT